MNNPVIANIRVEWDWVKPGIEKILAEQPQLTYRPEDVYAECVNGTATLFTQGRNFVITQMEVDQYSSNKIFLLWLAWTEERGLNHAASLIAFFEQIARDCGCTIIEIKSPVDKLEGYIIENGWDLYTRVFRRKLGQDEEK